MVIDPKNKELLIADMRLNAVLTCHFPEIFLCFFFSQVRTGIPESKTTA